jgi:protein SCO1/2
MVAATLALTAALAVVVLAQPGRHAPATSLQGSLPPKVPVRDFVLRDQDGRLVRLSALRGQVVVVSFMYTHCQDLCPTTATTIAGALDDLGHDVPALAVSVDPRGDTPQSARSFLLQRRIGGRMRFLLGTRAQLAPIWDAYGIRPQGQAFDHSAYVMVLDRRGVERSSFPVDQLTSEALAHDIRVLES